MRFVVTSFILLTIVLIFPIQIKAQSSIACEDRYLTLTNPVRGRNLWFDKSVKHLNDQYDVIKTNDYKGTWLLQYDVLSDEDLMSEINKFNDNQEKGILLEVSNSLAVNARVIYPYDAAWFSPNAVFLSGYTQSERIKLINEAFREFRNKFGEYPKVVGAWWIDSYSLEYLVKRYHVKTALIVADQLTTDNYGVWGQWWGVPYYPSKANVLTPASDLSNKLDVAIIQWAQRDLMLAYGKSWKYSNYSLQANDYPDVGKDVNYFKELVKTYLDCSNKVGQVTVGLETGMESIDSHEEYRKQIEALKSIKNLKSVTMSEFGDNFKRVYPALPKEDIRLGTGSANWLMNSVKRKNNDLNDEIIYSPNIAFNDYFLADKNGFLQRVLPPKQSQKELNWYPFYLIAVMFFMIVFKREKSIFLLGITFLYVCFGLILRSKFQYGWEIFYGPILDNLIIWQIMLSLVSVLLFWVFYKLKLNQQINLWFLPLVFGLDVIVQAIRLSYISGQYYLTLGVDQLRFIGLTFSNPYSIGFVNKDFPNYLAAGFLRFNFEKVWSNLSYSIIVYPLIHIILGIILGLIMSKVTARLNKVVLMVLILLTFIRFIQIFTADPRIAVPIY